MAKLTTTCATTSCITCAIAKRRTSSW